MTNKHTKILLLLLLLFAAAGTFYAWAMLGPVRKEPPSPKPLSLSDNRMRIQGLSFSGYDQGRRVLEIQADEFTIEKMRLGHFKLSLFNVARLRNGRIDIFGVPSDPRVERNAASGPGLTTHARNTNGVSFAGALNQESLSSFGRTPISSIRAEPVTVSFYNRDRLLTRVSASSSKVDLNKGGITFKGDVSLVSGSREIRAGEVRFIPEEAALEVRGVCEFDTGAERIVSERGLRCDLLLEPLSGLPGKPRPPFHGESRVTSWMPSKNPDLRHDRPVPPSLP